MFQLMVNNFVDTFQSSKKIFIETVVRHDSLAQTLNNFVDAQTEYTKKAVDTGFETGTNVYATLADKTFYTDILKTAQNSVNNIFSTTKKEK